MKTDGGVEPVRSLPTSTEGIRAEEEILFRYAPLPIITDIQVIHS
jgi:hypothetical protein